MKKTIALFAAVLMLLCAVPFAAIGEMNLAAAKTAGDFPDAVFDPLGDAASVEYSHNTNFTGESGTEFVSDGENGIKSASGGMRSSVVTITITFGEAVSNARLSFDYKVSSEARYDYLSVNGSTEKTLSGEIDWTNYSQTVTAGSVVTLAYVKDSSGDRGSDCVWFKNFALQSLGTVTFENVDPLAVLTVRNAEGNIENPTANSSVYALAAGDYSYPLTRFGIVEIRHIKANLVSVNVDRLVKEGYLSRQAVRGDRRKTELICTELAWPVIRRGQELQHAFFERLLENTDEKTRAAFFAAIEIMEKNLDKILKETN